MEVSDLVESVLVVGNDVVEVLQQKVEPAVVGELVEQVGEEEGEGLEEQKVGDPLVVGVVGRLQL